jgi:hypothetical protein
MKVNILGLYTPAPTSRPVLSRARVRRKTAAALDHFSANHISVMLRLGSNGRKMDDRKLRP